MYRRVAAAAFHRGRVQLQLPVIGRGDLARGMRQGDYLPSLFAQHQRQNLAFILSEPQEFLKLYPNDSRMKREILFLQTR